MDPHQEPGLGSPERLAAAGGRWRAGAGRGRRRGGAAERAPHAPPATWPLLRVPAGSPRVRGRNTQTRGKRDASDDRQVRRLFRETGFA